MILDTTLREGLQLFGVFFSSSDKKSIIENLAIAGIEEIEAGWTGGEKTEEIFNWCRGKIENSIISIWAPCREKAVKTAFDYGVKRINIGIPGSLSHMEKRLNMEKKGILKLISGTVRAGSLKKMEVSVGIEDIHGSDFDFIEDIIKTVKSSGGFRIRFSDTRGMMSPMLVKELVSSFKSFVDLEIGTHFHNDFGMAAANSITALESGADCTDASILGIGERAGITPLEEIASRLVVVDGDKNYDLKIIRNLCRKVSETADISISRIKPFAGSDIFSCESGIHIHAMEKDPSLMEPFSPELIGGRRKTAVGFKSGKSAVKSMLEKYGICIEDSKLDNFVRCIKQSSFSKKRPLSINEFRLLMENEIN